MLWRWLLFPNLMNQHLLVSNFSSVMSPPLSAFVELKKVGALLWIWLWLKGILWLVWSSIQTTTTLHIGNKTVSLSYHSGIHWRSTFNFLQELFLCTENLAKCWCKRPGFQPVLAFDMSSSLSLIISSFWYKVRGMWLFLSLEHLEAIVGLLSGLISILCLR